MPVDILMPQLGQAMVTGLIVAWHVPDGETVTAGAPLLTVESDKSAFEIEAAASGTVRHLLAAGIEADVGAVLGTIAASGELTADAAADVPPRPDPATARPSRAVRAGQSRTLASPRARAMAEGRIALADVVPSGSGGMITAGDVEKALARVSDAAVQEAHDRQPIGAGQRFAMERLGRSWQQAPHIVQMVDVDAGGLVAARDAIRTGALAVTLNDVIIKAVADTLADFPDLNVHIEGDDVVPASHVDISIAVATERGLRTPTLRDVAGRTLDEVAALARQAIDAARTGRGALRRASLTISNLGRQGIRFGTPVLNLDETILVFVGAIVDRAVVRNGQIVVRPEMGLSIAFDHRVVDGLRAAEFTAALRGRLESFAPDERPATPHEARTVRLDSSERLRCDLRAGAHRWAIDEPPSIGGSDAGPDPVTSVLGALLSCLTIAFKLVAKRRGVPIARIAGAIEATPKGKVKAMTITLEIWSSADAAQVESLLKPAKAACYVHDMLRADLPVDVRIVAHPAPSEPA